MAVGEHIYRETVSADDREKDTAISLIDPDNVSDASCALESEPNAADVVVAIPGQPMPEGADIACLPGETTAEILNNLPPSTIETVRGGLVRYAQTLLSPNSKVDAEDVVAEAFLAFVAKGETHLGFYSVGHLVNYLRTTVGRRVIDHHKRQDTKRAIPTDPTDLKTVSGSILPPEKTVIATLVFDEFLETATKMVPDPEKQRLLFEVLFPGESQGALARELDENYDTLRTRVGRIRKKLRPIVSQILDENNSYLTPEQREQAS